MHSLTWQVLPPAWLRAVLNHEVTLLQASELLDLLLETPFGDPIRVPSRLETAAEVLFSEDLTVNLLLH